MRQLRRAGTPVVPEAASGKPTRSGYAAALWDGTADVMLGLRRLDVLRRAGLFEAAAA